MASHASHPSIQLTVTVKFVGGFGRCAVVAALNSNAPRDGGFGLGLPLKSQEDAWAAVPEPIAGLVDCKVKSFPKATSNGFVVILPVVCDGAPDAPNHKLFDPET